MGKPQKNRSEPVAEHHDGTSSPLPDPGKSTDEVQKNTGFDSAEPGIISRHDALTYIHDMARELKLIAESSNFLFLAYLIELVTEESAAQQSRDLRHD